jgi:hypothetical protein
MPSLFAAAQSQPAAHNHRDSGPGNGPKHLFVSRLRRSTNSDGPGQHSDTSEGAAHSLSHAVILAADSGRRIPYLAIASEPTSAILGDDWHAISDSDGQVGKPDE